MTFRLQTQMSPRESALWRKYMSIQIGNQAILPNETVVLFKFHSIYHIVSQRKKHRILFEAKDDWLLARYTLVSVHSQSTIHTVDIKCTFKYTHKHTQFATLYIKPYDIDVYWKCTCANTKAIYLTVVAVIEHHCNAQSINTRTHTSTHTHKGGVGS